MHTDQLMHYKINWIPRAGSPNPPHSLSSNPAHTPPQPKKKNSAAQPAVPVPELRASSPLNNPLQKIIIPRPKKRSARTNRTVPANKALLAPEKKIFPENLRTVPFVATNLLPSRRASSSHARVSAPRSRDALLLVVNRGPSLVFLLAAIKAGPGNPSLRSLPPKFSCIGQSGEDTYIYVTVYACCEWIIQECEDERCYKVKDGWRYFGIVRNGSLVGFVFLCENISNVMR